jgi:hypothetical protein
MGEDADFRQFVQSQKREATSYTKEEQMEALVSFLVETGNFPIRSSKEFGLGSVWDKMKSKLEIRRDEFMRCLAERAAVDDTEEGIRSLFPTQSITWEAVVALSKKTNKRGRRKRKSDEVGSSSSAKRPAAAAASAAVASDGEESDEE